MGIKTSAQKYISQFPKEYSRADKTSECLLYSAVVCESPAPYKTWAILMPLLHRAGGLITVDPDFIALLNAIFYLQLAGSCKSGGY